MQTSHQEALAKLSEDFRQHKFSENSRQHYPKELKTKAIDLLRSGVTAYALAKSLKIPAYTIRLWHKAIFGKDQKMKKASRQFKQIKIRDDLLGILGSLSLKTPKGFLVSGLSKSDIIDVLKKLEG